MRIDASNKYRKNNQQMWEGLIERTLLEDLYQQQNLGEIVKLNGDNGDQD